MPKITLGTANFYRHYGVTKNKFVSSEMIKVLPKILKKNNINNFDTALEDYFPSNFLKSLKFKNLKVTTKIKLPNKNKQKFLKNLKKKIYKQIENLKIANFEAILIHDIKDLSSKYGEKLRQILLELKFEKKTKMIGASLYSTNEINKTMKFIKLDIIQFPLNIFNTSFISSKWKKYFKKNKIKIQIRSIFLQGLLLQKEDIIKKLSLNKDLKKKLINYNSWLRSKGFSNIYININFLKKYFKIIDYLIIGSDNYSQFLQTLKYLKSKKNKKLVVRNFSTQNNKIIDPRRW
tara:strand:+ start:24 stop:896 length:873 start_codon:yes stop_codon:yes gene_type:complete